MSEEIIEKPKRGPKPLPRPTEIGQSDSSGYTLVGKNEELGLSLVRTPGGKFGVYINAWHIGGKEIRVLYPTNDRSLAESVLKTGKTPGKLEVVPDEEQQEEKKEEVPLKPKTSKKTVKKAAKKVAKKKTVSKK